MNTPLRRVAMAVTVMVVALLANATYVQVIKADDLRADPRNSRVLLDEYSRQRGQISASGQVLAASRATDDRYKYLREYPNPYPYAPVTGFYSMQYGSAGLGYVNAMNQSTRPHDGPTVLSYYRAFGDDPATGRRELLSRDWTCWRDAIIADLAGAHPDLPARLREVRIMRYGHAMAIPAPGIRSAPCLAALQQAGGRIHHAHSDLSAYSVFEEAYDQGLNAGRRLLAGRGGHR